MLTRYADVDPTTSEYQQKVKGLPAFHMIGQRLFTGRVAVAQAALTFTRAIFQSTRAYTDGKMCWSPGPAGEIALSEMPPLRALYDEAEQNYSLLQSFVSACEEDLSQCLRAGSVPSLQLVEAIAVAKVRAVEDSIRLTHRLKNEVGSYALMKDSGFGQTDFLQCCKFAEGDSRILMQKMARDRMSSYSAAVKKGENPSGLAIDKCVALANLMEAHIEAGRAADKHAAWDLCWREVYGLADTVAQGTMESYLASRKK